MNRYIYDNYYDFISQLYYEDNIELQDNEALIRNVTFQVTDKCNLACTYCYQENKGNRMMNKDTAKKIVDLLFRMYDDNNSTFINKKTKGLVIEFIGGEQLLNVEVMDFVCDYFLTKCIELHHPWLYHSRFSMITNGTLYFNPQFQQFLRKYNKFLSFGVTIDGPQQVHDSCRIYKDGRGSFQDAILAEDDYSQKFNKEASISSKVTIAPGNLDKINSIFDFFVDRGKKVIHANVVYEAEWTTQDAKEFYNRLKQISDKLLLRSDDIMVTLFDDRMFCPLKHDDLQCWCGGAGKMLAFDPDGIAYPCLRYMSSSLGNDIPPVIIGDYNGIYCTEDTQKIKILLESINRRTKNTDECFNCPIAAGCSDCEAWNYQKSGGTFNIKCTNICKMHKAQSLANVYYWNNYYKKNNIDKNFLMFLPKEDALQIIDEDEYDMLLELSGGVPGNVEEYLSKMSQENEK